MQSGTSNSFPQNYYSDHGSSANNLGLVQHNVVPVDALRGDGQTTLGWIGQSSSSMITQNQVNPEELNAGHGWLSVLGAQTGHGQRLEERHSEPNNDQFVGSVKIGLSNGPVTNGPSTLHSASSSALPQNIDLNVKYEGNDDEIMGVGLGFCPFKPGGSETDGVPPASDSSNPLVISSGTAGYVVEENDNRSCLSLDGQCLSCKRKAPENASGELSLGGSSSSAQRAEKSEWQAVPAQDNTSSSLNISTFLNNPSSVSHPEQLNPRLGVGMTGASSDMLQSPSVAGNAESFQRNIRLRTENEQDLVPARITSTGTPVRNSHVQSPNQPSVLSTGTPVTNSHVQSPNQPSVLFPFNRSSVSRSTAVAVNTTPQVPPLVHFPNSSQTLQPSPWNWVTSSRASGVSSISPAVNVHEGDALRLEESSRNTPRMLVPQTERGSSAQNPTNVSFASGNAHFFGNIAPTSQNVSSSGVHQSPSPAWFPQINTAEQYEQRLSRIVHRSMTTSAGSESGMESSYYPPHPGASAPGWQNSYRPLHPGAFATGWQNSYCPPHPGPAATGGQSNYRPPHPGASATMPEMVFARAGNARPPVPHFRSIFLPRATSLPYALRPMTADQRRRRLVSEVCQALGIVHRNGALQFEDVMIIDHSVLYGVPDWNDVHDLDEEPDVHEDMRLDIDEMSYEELLALEEHIGNVTIGLNEEAILAHLRRRKYQSIRIGLPVEDEPCCICQEDYVDGEDLGKLDCGHDFHFICIKRWLVQKNSCPICKLKGLAT